MSKLTCLLIFFALVNNSFQFIKQGRCPHVQSNPFNLFAFKGKWHEVQATPHPSKPPRKCVTYKILYNNVDHGTIYSHSISQANVFDDKKGDLKVIRNPPYHVDLKIEFPGSSPSQYQIIATDYNLYAICYSCTPLTLGLNPTNEVQCRIWSRMPNITPAVRSMIRAELLRKGILECMDHLQECDQTNCPR